MRTPTLTLISLLVVVVAATLLGPAGGPGLIEPTEAEAGRTCPGAGRSPAKMKVTKAAQLVRCLVNKRRADRGLRRLKHKRKVTNAAIAHTRRMRAADCFAHTCPGESPLAGRLSRSDYLPCNCSWSVGETIAYGKGRRRGSPKAIVKAWMKSPSHRATLLTKSFQHVGIGVRRGSPYKSKSSYGTYTLDVGYKR
jgi:uncharacterized protein YkwD